MNKRKLKCDNIISITLIITILFLFFFVRLMTFMALMIYPICCLFLQGVFYLSKIVRKKYKKPKTLVFRLILAIFYIGFSSLILWLFFSQEKVTLSYIVYFLSLPMFFIGFAAILKGGLVDVYSPFYRKANIIIGIITLIVTTLAILYVDFNLILSIISLIGLLAFNGILRSGLYLSEYGLSLRNLKNIKYVFYIMDNLVILNLEEDYKR
ncbi:MAG: hypothetical protein P8Y23_06000 [Candidatus Lokiarchaeota archaeon]